MTNFRNVRFKKLISDLSQDPKIKAAIEKITEKSQVGQHVKALKDFLPFITKLAKFGGKKTAMVGQHLTLIIFLFELSVLLKTNVFDRPEVRKFFSENWGVVQKRVAAMYLFCSNYVKLQLSRRRRDPAADKSPES